MGGGGGGVSLKIFYIRIIIQREHKMMAIHCSSNPA